MFAEHGPRFDGEINAELFEAVLSYSRTRGSARLLLAALAGARRRDACRHGVATEELRAAAGLGDSSYRRAREQLLDGGEVSCEGGGGRARTNRWHVHDPRIDRASRLIGAAPPAAPSTAQPTADRRARPAPGDKARSDSRQAESAPSRRTSRDRARSSRETPAQSRTVSSRETPVNPGRFARNPGQSRTVRPKPRQKPRQKPRHPTRAREGNPRTSGTTPPNPPQGGDCGAWADRGAVRQRRGRKRRRRPCALTSKRSAAVLRATERRLTEALASGSARCCRDAVAESVFEIWFEPLALVATDSGGVLVIAGDPETSVMAAAAATASADCRCAERVGRSCGVADEVGAASARREERRSARPALQLRSINRRCRDGDRGSQPEGRGGQDDDCGEHRRDPRR